MLINTLIITLAIKNKLKEVNALGFLYIPALLSDFLLTAAGMDVINHFIGA